MSEAYIGEIRLVAFQRILPTGWELCDGHTLPITGNEGLHDVIHDDYGGDGVTTFAVPDLRGRVPMHRSDAVPVAGQGGEEAVTLTSEHLPPHHHRLQGSSAAASTTDPRNNVLAAGGSYASAPDGTLMSDASLRSTGGDLPHDNIQPSLAMRYIICRDGVAPS